MAQTKSKRCEKFGIMTFVNRNQRWSYELSDCFLKCRETLNNVDSRIEIVSI